MAAPEVDRFQTVRAGSRTLFSIPQAPFRVRRAAVRCYQGHTWKKRLIRNLISALVSMRADSILWSHESVPIVGVSSTAFQGWLSEITQALDELRLYPAIVWPANPKRGRVYVHLLDSRGGRKAFAKIGLDGLNSRLIENERRALETLQTMNLRRTKVPAVLSSGSLKGKSWLVVEAAPLEAQLTNWEAGLKLDENIREFGQPIRRVSFASIESQSWWERFTESPIATPSFLKAVLGCAAFGVDVCRAHGDLNHTNVLRSDNAIWFLDWEQSHENAPCLTDFICIAVDKRWPQMQRDPMASLAEFLRAHWKNREQDYRNQVLLALAFLGGAAFTPAIALIRAWQSVSRDS